MSAYASVRSVRESTSTTTVSSTRSAGAASASGGLATAATSVQSRVDTFLASFGDELAGDQQLRMIIGLLILSALLGKEGDQPMSKAAEMGGLLSDLGSLTQRNQVAVFSATNIIQMQQQSTLVYSDQAVQATTEGQPSGQAGGGTRLDVTA